MAKAGLRIPHTAWLFALALLAAAHAPAAELTVTLKDQKGLAVEDCVVSLTPLVPLAALPATALPDATIRQTGGQFWPYVTAVRTGTRVHFPNEDEVQHHVYSVSPAKRFEIPLFGGKDATDHSEVFAQPGVVSIGCNIHDWMVAYVVADLPAGRYKCEVWHPRLAQPIIEEITFAADGPAAKRTLELTLKVDRRVRRALEGAAGGVYR